MFLESSRTLQFLCSQEINSATPEPLRRQSFDKAQRANHNLSPKIKAERGSLLITRHVIID